MKIKHSTLLSCLLICFLCMSCHKNESKKSDPEDKYVGKYQVHENISSYGFPPCGDPYSSEKDTVISVVRGKTDTTLVVLGREVYLDSTGHYYAYHYSLRLWNDSISSTFMNGGLGCGQYEIYKGYRISTTP